MSAAGGTSGNGSGGGTSVSPQSQQSFPQSRHSQSLSLSPQRLQHNPHGGVGEREQQRYGLGNRILPDQHARRPIGGELEAGYGIGNRHLNSLDASVLPLSPEARPEQLHFAGEGGSSGAAETRMRPGGVRE